MVTSSRANLVHLPLPRNPPFLSDMIPEKRDTWSPFPDAYFPVLTLPVALLTSLTAIYPLFHLVPRRRLELLPPKRGLPPQSSVSTYSTTSARQPVAGVEGVEPP